MSKKIFDIIPPTPPVTSPFLQKKGEKPRPLPAKKVPEIVFKRKKGQGLRKVLTGIFLFLIFVFLLLHFVFSKVELEIWPETETLNFEERVLIDVKINQSDFSKKTIPGKLFEEQRNVSQQFSSSGKTLKEESSQGIIRVYNNYHLSQVLVKNTRFQPPLEKVLYFCSMSSVVIPAKSELDVEVNSCLPGGKKAAGEEYNIGPSTFSVPGLSGLPQYYSIYGKSFLPMSGGFKGEVSMVSEEDLDSAKKTLLEKLKKETREHLKSKFSEEFILLDEGLSQEIIEAVSSVSAGAEAESFNFNLKIQSKAILFSITDLENFAKEFINLNAQRTNKKIQLESLKIDYSPESIDVGSGKIFLNLKISVKIYSDIDETSLKKGLSGKSLNEIQLLLKSQPQIIQSQVKAFPFWLRKVPANTEKITVRLNLD